MEFDDEGNPVPVPQETTAPLDAPAEAPGPPPPICRVEQYVRGQQTLHALLPVEPETRAGDAPIQGLPVRYIASGRVGKVILGKPCAKDFQVVIDAADVEEAFDRLPQALQDAAPTVLAALEQEVTRAEIQRSPNITNFRLHRDGRGRDNGDHRKRRF